MSYLRFEKAVMTNLQESLRRELLRTNRSGAYSSSTIADCNTRKYHGLLVVPVPELDDENHVLLSSFDCTVIQHGAEFNLGLHKYQGNNYSPNGHKYIREFTCDVVPTMIYRVGGVILKRETIFQCMKTASSSAIRLLMPTVPLLCVSAHSLRSVRYASLPTKTPLQAELIKRWKMASAPVCMPDIPTCTCSLIRKTSLSSSPTGIAV